MTAYIFTSVLAGIVSGAYGLATYGAGLWATLGWYMIGSCSGLLLLLGLVIAATMMRPAANPNLRGAY